jgi:hypothetical protein
MLSRLFFVGAVLVGLLMLMANRANAAPQVHSETISKIATHSATGVDQTGYVGSTACSRCHAGIAVQFARASMGHSLSRITPDFLKTLPVPASYYNAKTGHHYDVRAENGKLYQTEYETDAAGVELFRNTH